MDCDADFDSGVCGTCRACTAGYTPDFPSTEGVAGQLMVIGVITVILNSTSNISNGVLQAIGKAIFL